MEIIISFIQRAILQGTPLLFGATGEILTEKSGNLNLGIPGIMYIGAISGVVGGFFYQNSAARVQPVPAILIPLLCCLAGSLLTSLLYCFLTVTLKANQNVTGLAITTFGVGVGNFFGGSLIKIVKSDVPYLALVKIAKAYKTTLPFASGMGPVGQLFFSYGFLVYLAVILAVAVSLFLSRSRAGLYLRAVGENPATADAAGINVTLYKYLATCLGAGICGIGGLYYVLDYNQGIWATTGQIEALGWLAVALVIFTTWKPLNAIWGAYLFGMLYWLYQFLPTLLGITLASYMTDLVQMLPYVVTIVVLIVVSMRKKKENQPPAHLGLAYFREER
jgi:ABC-type uncharacterized transport system permease subunit